MSNLKPTKLKIIISSIPLILILISDFILDVNLVLFGSLAEIPKITIYAMRVIPFFPQVKKFVHLFAFPINNIYPPVVSFKIIIIAALNDILVGLVYFILIYLIYSFIQYYRYNRK